MYIKSINVLSNKKRALTQTQANQRNTFFSKKAKISHPSLRFNNSIVLDTPYQNHLGIVLDARLKFEEHLKITTTKVNKTVGLLQKLLRILPKLVLITMYEALVRQHLDYGDITYDKACNKIFHQKQIYFYFLPKKYYFILILNQS